MSLTYRFFVGDKRLSTAVVTKKGEFLQVFPEKTPFYSESAWRQHWIHFNTCRVETTLPKTSKKEEKTREVVKKEDWTFSSALTFTAPAGSYYIGDLCYVLSDEIYDTVFRDVGGYDPGLYQKKNSTDFFLVDGTAYGDGLYKSTDLKSFAVDAGIIGIVPMSLVSQKGAGGHFYTFKEPVQCTFRGGKFSFLSEYHEIVIDTRGSDEEAW